MEIKNEIIIPVEIKKFIVRPKKKDVLIHIDRKSEENKRIHLKIDHAQPKI